VLVACFVTVLEFPTWFADVVGSTTLGVTLLVVRNGLLVIASLLAARRLWRDTVSEPTPALPAQAARAKETLASS
jgi:hypothetical protein